MSQATIFAVAAISGNTKAALLRTMEHNCHLADRRTTPVPQYKPGQRVWPSSKDIPLNCRKKEIIGLFETDSLQFA